MLSLAGLVYCNRVKNRSPQAKRWRIQASTRAKNPYDGPQWFWEGAGEGEPYSWKRMCDYWRLFQEVYH